MAAGLGFKDFVTGEVLTAADVDGYLMQGVWVFASAAARDAAVTSPQEGNFAYLKDTNVTTYYTGSAWANLDTTGMTNPMTTTGDTIYSSSGSTPARLGIGSTGQVLTVAAGVPSWATPASPSSGLTLIGTTSFTTSSAVNINSVFSSTYDNYRILIDLVGSTTNMNIAWRFRVSGADDTTSNYNFSELFSYSTNVASAGQNAQNSIPRFTQYSVDRSYVAADVFTPFTATPSSITANSNLNYAAGFHGLISNAQFTSSTSFDGFSLIPSTGTITGKVIVYGYAK